MMRIATVGLLFCAAWAASATPAFAAEGVECIPELINDSRRAALFAAYRADVPPPEPEMAALRSADQTCTDLHGWNEPQRDAARRYAVARIFHDRLLLESMFMQEQLALIGNVMDATDRMLVDRWYSAGDIPDVEADQLARRMIDAGVPFTEQNSQQIGEFIFSREAMLRSRAVFAAL